MNSLNELKKAVIESEEISELYQMDIELTENISALHRSYLLADTKMEQTEIKGQLSLGNSILSICRDRIPELRNTNNRLNHNFRMHAKNMLDKQLYKQIINNAMIGHSKE